MGGVHDAGIDHVQVQQIQRLGDVREDIVMIVHVDEQGGTPAPGLFAQQNQGQARLADFHNGAGMPGDFRGGVVQEIIIAQLRPDRVGIGLIPATVVDDGAGAGFRVCDQFILVDRVFQSAPQRGQRGVVQVGEQGVFPTVPQRRVGAVDIGNREQVEVVQVDNVAHLAGKAVDHLRVADILPLRGF